MAAADSLTALSMSASSAPEPRRDRRATGAAQRPERPRADRPDFADRFDVAPDFLADFRADFFAARFAAVFFGGTFAPILRASDSPIAMACLRLFTAPPLPPLPLLSVPRLRRRMALATVFEADFP